MNFLNMDLTNYDFDKVIFDLDSYKLSQFCQYPKGTKKIMSYDEARGSEIAHINNIVNFGNQMILKKLAKQITMLDVEIAKVIYEAHGVPFHYEGWKKLVEKHNGYLPLRIMAVEEGKIIPLKNISSLIINDDDDFFWLTSLIETVWLRKWYPTTVATVSKSIKDLIEDHMIETIGNTQGVEYKLHDFGSRGVSSTESAMVGGLGHLVNFVGTDTTSALFGAIANYGVKLDNPVGFSLPASEHSTITSWGRENEVKAYENMIKCFGDKFIFACVSDSFDIDNAVENLWGGTLKKLVQDMKAKLIVRPDSGDTVEGVIKILHQLNEKFGSTVNSKGYMVLNKVGVIQGDGVCYETVKQILDRMKQEGFSTDNIAFGMGGALLQQVNRDTFKYALKCCAMLDENNVWQEVYKDPKNSFKKSKKGILNLFKDEKGNYETRNCSYDELLQETGELKTVFLNGKITNPISFEQVRKNANERQLRA